MKDLFHVCPPVIGSLILKWSLARDGQFPPFLVPGVGFHLCHVRLKIRPNVLKIIEEEIPGIIQLVQIDREIPDVAFLDQFKDLRPSFLVQLLVFLQFALIEPDNHSISLHFAQPLDLPDAVNRSGGLEWM
jgi:hypothetical protein